MVELSEVVTVRLSPVLLRAEGRRWSFLSRFARDKTALSSLRCRPAKSSRAPIYSPLT